LGFGSGWDDEGCLRDGWQHEEEAGESLAGGCFFYNGFGGVVFKPLSINQFEDFEGGGEIELRCDYVNCLTFRFAGIGVSLESDSLDLSPRKINYCRFKPASGVELTSPSTALDEKRFPLPRPSNWTAALAMGLALVSAMVQALMRTFRQSLPWMA